MYITSRVIFRTASLVFILFITVNATTVKKAHAWGDAIPAELMHQAWRTLYDNYLGVLLGSAKVAAIQAINQQVNMLIGGGASGQPLIITNWDTFLFQTPTQNANLYMNDFFTMTSRGKFSSANYLGVGDIKGLAGNYQSYLINSAKRATIGSAAQIVSMNLDEYTPNPETMFREGDFRAFNAFVANPANNPMGYVMMAEQAYQSKLMEEMRVAEIKAQSSGFLGVEKNGITVSPAAAVEALSNMNVQNMGNLITSANSAAELASNAAMAMANRMITQMVQQGIGQVGASVQRQVSSVQQQANAALNEATRTLGPAAPYVNAAVRQGAANVRINPNTSPPPAASNDRTGSE